MSEKCSNGLELAVETNRTWIIVESSEETDAISEVIEERKAAVEDIKDSESIQSTMETSKVKKGHWTVTRFWYEDHKVFILNNILLWSFLTREMRAFCQDIA